MFGQNTAAYKSFMETNIAEMNQHAAVWGFQFTYDDDSWTGPTLSNVGSGIIDCEQWLATEIANGSPTAPGIGWDDPTLLLYGLWPSHVNQPGYLIPQCAPACTRFTQFVDQIYSATPNTPPPRFTPNPLARATGGWQSANSYYFQGDQFNTVWFDGPCEAYYDQTAGKVYVIACNDAHKTELLTPADIELDPTVIAQSPALTANWARLVDRSTEFGVTVGCVGWIQCTTRAGAIVQDIAISHFNGWGLAISTQGPIRVENVAMSYNLNHIRLQAQTGASFVIDSTLVNTTRPWYGISVDNDGAGVQCVDMGPLATCALIDTDIVTTIAPTVVNFMRGVRLVDNSGQAAVGGDNKLWIETTLFNITGFFVGDAGTLYNNPSPNTFLWTIFDNTIYSQPQNLNPQPAYAFGSVKAGFPRMAGYWEGQSIVWYGCQFLDVVGDVVGLTGGVQAMSYNVDSFAQLQNLLFTGASFQFTIPGSGQTLPTTTIGAKGRPWGFSNCYGIFDNVQYNPIAVAYDYPIFGPGFQGTSPMWKWGEGVSPWVSNFQICHGELDFSGDPNSATIGAADLSLTSSYDGLVVPLQVTLAIQSAIEDWALALANGSPAPQFGISNCQEMESTVQQQLANEAQYHTAATDAALLAIIHSQQPFYVPATATQLTEASEWEEPMSRYNPSSPPWPPEQPSTFCSDSASCAPYVLMELAPVLASSTWADTQGVATVSFNGFNGAGDFGDAATRYIGNSYDPDRGLVIDTSFAQGLQYLMSYPTVYMQFTVMWWWMIPTFKTATNVVILNRNGGVFLQMGGNSDNSPGGTIYSDGQNINGVSGGATASMRNENSGCCPCTDIPVTQGGVCPIDRSLMDTWVHFAAAVSNDYQYTELYLNGHPVFDCVGFGGLGAPIQPVFGGPTSMPVFTAFSGKVSGFQVVAGKLSDSAISNIYATQLANPYVGPASFPAISGSLILQVQYSSSLNTFVISPTETTYTVASLGQFSSGFLVSDPTHQVSTPVLSPKAQFSFPTPAGMSTWTIAIRVLWTSAPTFTPWFHIPYPSSQSPATAEILVLLSGGNTICVMLDVTQVTTTYDTPVYGSQSCLQGGAVSFPLNTWTTYSFTFNNGQAALYINGGEVGQFTGLTSAMATQSVLLFQIPSQMWLYTTQDQLQGAPLNGGFIASIDVYSSVVA
jgi:hypothetical protein